MYFFVSVWFALLWFKCDFGCESQKVSDYMSVRTDALCSEFAPRVEDVDPVDSHSLCQVTHFISSICSVSASHVVELWKTSLSSRHILLACTGCMAHKRSSSQAIAASVGMLVFHYLSPCHVARGSNQLVVIPSSDHKLQVSPFTTHVHHADDHMFTSIKSIGDLHHRTSQDAFLESAKTAYPWLQVHDFVAVHCRRLVCMTMIGHDNHRSIGTSTADLQTRILQFIEVAHGNSGSWTIQPPVDFVADVGGLVAQHKLRAYRITSPLVSCPWVVVANHQHDEPCHLYIPKISFESYGSVPPMNVWDMTRLLLGAINTSKSLDAVDSLISVPEPVLQRICAPLLRLLHVWGIPTNHLVFALESQDALDGHCQLALRLFAPSNRIVRFANMHTCPHTVRQFHSFACARAEMERNASDCSVYKLACERDISDWARFTHVKTWYELGAATSQARHHSNINYAFI